MRPRFSSPTLPHPDERGASTTRTHPSRPGWPPSSHARFAAGASTCACCRSLSRGELRGRACLWQATRAGVGPGGGPVIGHRRLDHASVRRGGAAVGRPTFRIWAGMVASPGPTGFRAHPLPRLVKSEHRAASAAGVPAVGRVGGPTVGGRPEVGAWPSATGCHSVHDGRYIGHSARPCARAAMSTIVSHDGGVRFVWSDSTGKSSGVPSPKLFFSVHRKC